MQNVDITDVLNLPTIKLSDVSSRKEYVPTVHLESNGPGSTAQSVGGSRGNPNMSNSERELSIIKLECNLYIRQATSSSLSHFIGQLR